MARKKNQQKPPVSQERIDAALANAISTGDVVNFRILFGPASPLRQDSTEIAESDKYSFLFTADTTTPAYREALSAAQDAAVREHVRNELVKKGPAQLPSTLLVLLADNAVRQAKYTEAAQAYELLRIRRRMQALYFDQAEAALDNKLYAEAARGFWIGAGLSYDFAAFPEPMPRIPNYQSRALVLHARYPTRPEECVSLQPAEQHARIALAYLIGDPDAIKRLTARSLEEHIALLEHVVRIADPDWDQFTERFRSVCAVLQDFERKQIQTPTSNLATDADHTSELSRLKAIPAQLLGREIENGEWWQYLKELAYQHPASVLFLGRQLVDRSTEIIKPFLLRESPIAARLKLV